MGYTANALIRAAGGSWSGQEIELSQVEDLDGVVDLLRDAADTALAVLFVESDDEWLAVLRVHGDDEPRLFLSDDRVLAHSGLARMLFADVAEQAEDDDDSAMTPQGDHLGDPDLLADLGTSGPQLEALCDEESLLPSDVIAEVCSTAGCLGVLEELRGE